MATKNGGGGDTPANNVGSGIKFAIILGDASETLDEVKQRIKPFWTGAEGNESFCLFPGGQLYVRRCLRSFSSFYHW